MTKTNENELISQATNQIEIFQNDRIDSYLAQKRKEAEEFNKTADMTTAAGQNKIRTESFKLAKEKAKRDKEGLALTEGYRAKTAIINEERKQVKAGLEEIQHLVRQPLTDFENEEKARIANLEEKLRDIVSYGNMSFISSKEGEEILTECKKYFNDISDLQEFEMKANNEFQKAVADISGRITNFKKLEAEQEELEKLRKEKEEREQQERERRIAKEAEENANRVAREEAERVAREVEQEKYRLEAEKKAAEEQARQAKINLENQKQAAELRARQAEEKAAEDKKAAKIEAERAKEAAIQKEREAARLKKEAEDKAAEVRKADLTHRKEINIEALDAIKEVVRLCVEIDDLEQEKAIVKAIAQGEIPHISIKY